MSRADVRARLCNSHPGWRTVFKQLKNARRNGKIDKALNTQFYRIAERLAVKRGRENPAPDGTPPEEPGYLPNEVLLEIFLAMSWDQAVSARDISKYVQDLIDKYVLSTIKTVSVSSNGEIGILNKLLKIPEVVLNVENVSFKRLMYTEGPIDSPYWDKTIRLFLQKTRSSLTRFEMQHPSNIPAHELLEEGSSIRHFSIKPLSELKPFNRWLALDSLNKLTSLEMPLDFCTVSGTMVLPEFQKYWSIFPLESPSADVRPYSEENGNGRGFIRDPETNVRVIDSRPRSDSVKHLAIFSSRFIPVLIFMQTPAPTTGGRTSAIYDFAFQFPKIKSIVFDGPELPGNVKVCNDYPDSLRVLTLPAMDMYNQSKRPPHRMPDLDRLCVYTTIHDKDHNIMGRNSIFEQYAKIGLRASFTELFVEPSTLFFGKKKTGMFDPEYAGQFRFPSVYYFGPLPMAAMKAEDTPFDFNAEFRAVIESTRFTADTPYRFPVKWIPSNIFRSREIDTMFELFASFNLPHTPVDTLCFWDLDDLNRIGRDQDLRMMELANAVVTKNVLSNTGMTVYLVNSIDIIKKITEVYEEDPGIIKKRYEFMMLRASTMASSQFYPLDRTYMTETEMGLYPYPLEELRVIPGIQDLPLGSRVNGMDISTLREDMMDVDQ